MEELYIGSTKHLAHLSDLAKLVRRLMKLKKLALPNSLLLYGPKRISSSEKNLLIDFRVDPLKLPNCNFLLEGIIVSRTINLIHSFPPRNCFYNIRSSAVFLITNGSITRN